MRNLRFDGPVRLVVTHLTATAPGYGAVPVRMGGRCSSACPPSNPNPSPSPNPNPNPNPNPDPDQVLLSLPARPEVSIDCSIAYGEVTRVPWLRSELERSLQQQITVRGRGRVRVRLG